MVCRKKLESIISNIEKHMLNGIDGEKYTEVPYLFNSLTGGETPSLLFYLLADKLGYLLDNDPNIVVSTKGILIRRKINKIIKRLGPLFLNGKQTFENRHTLLNPNDLTPDTGIILPNEPVIWVANHGFKDDALASILAMQRNGYIMFGALPDFYNTFDGPISWLNGVIMTNRNFGPSRHFVIDKGVRVLELGADLLIFPEGVHNKSANQLILPLWSGFYEIAKRTGAKVVPIIHYAKDYSQETKPNDIFTVVDDPIDVCSLSQEQATTMIRDIMSGWYMLLMEKNCPVVSRKELLFGFPTADSYWLNSLKKAKGQFQYYDTFAETHSDYRPKEIFTSADVWRDIDTPFAKNLFEAACKRDYQRLI